MPQVAPRGRPPASSRAAVAEVAVELFFDHGYSGTTIAMIAEGAGISKTSFFRYFSSKAEIVWADFDAHTDRLRERLAAGPAGLPAVRIAVVDNLRADLDSGGVSLRRFELLDTSPELRSEESVRWFAWAEIVTEHLRLSSGREHPTPSQAAVGSAIQATMLAVLRDGVRHPADPETLLARLDAELLLLCTAVESLLRD
jgi:AcrR family transcriptional regulator